MLDHEGGYIARRPRHRAAGSAGVRVRVERRPGSVPGTIDAELVDLSRSGIRLRAAVPLAVEESITVRLHHDVSGVGLTRAGTVRWRSRDQCGTWSVGCVFPQPLDWETLGELFLNQVLSTDPPSLDPEESTPADAPSHSG